MSNAETVAQALVEYGQAWRGDWNSFDGRTCRDDMAAVASALRSSDPVTLAQLRSTLGVCPDGGGHWPEYCADIECPTWKRSVEKETSSTR